MLLWIHGVSLKDNLRSQLYGIEYKRRKKPEDITRTMLDMNYLQGAPSSDGWTISGEIIDTGLEIHFFGGSTLLLPSSRPGSLRIPVASEKTL